MSYKNTKMDIRNRRTFKEDPLDFYETPRIATKLLLQQVCFVGSILEPAVGKGAIEKVLSERLPNQIIAFDVHQYSKEYKKKDFFSYNKKVGNIVTNPPYNNARAFIDHSLEITRRRVCMLLKLTFLETQGRYELFRDTPLERVIIFSKRISCNKKNKATAFAWYVWNNEKDKDQKPYIEWVTY